MNLVVGSLVESKTAFTGIGKIVSISSENKNAIVGFFSSPRTPLSNQIDADIEHLSLVTSLDMKAEVFVQFPSTQTWKIGHYDGERPGNRALIKFSKEMSDNYDLTELFIPNALFLSSFFSFKIFIIFSKSV